MYSLSLHDDAQKDLDALWEADPTTCSRLEVVIEELMGNQDLLDRLSQHDFGLYGSEKIHVSKWFEYWNQGKDIWRLKVWELEKQGIQYRIIYAYFPQQSHYSILAVVHRDFDYDPNHAVSKRLDLTYEALREGRCRPRR